jgi:Secretion system C-terminal sorting domain
VYVLYANAHIYQLFPNPVSHGGQLTIFTDGNDIEIQFYDSAGKLIQHSEAFGMLFSQEVNANIPAGLYFYRILRKGVPQASGRLVVL